MRRLILLCGLAAALPAALAQTPAKPTITAEAVEAVRVKPDSARIVYAVSARNADSDTATTDNDTATQAFVDAIGKLKLGGVKAAADPLRIDKVELANNRGVAAPGVGEFNAVRAIVVTATEADPAKLTGLVEKVQKEAAKQGVGGELGPASYNGMQYERSGGVKVAYSRSEAGWDEATSTAVTQATKRAMERAKALAAGAGLTLGELVSVGEVPTDAPKAAAPPVTTTYASTPYLGGAINPGVTADALDTFVDGELVRKVKVRVVYATK
jgi:uncharacterized protein YggE